MDSFRFLLGLNAFFINTKLFWNCDFEKKYEFWPLRSVKIEVANLSNWPTNKIWTILIDNISSISKFWPLKTDKIGMTGLFSSRVLYKFSKLFVYSIRMNRIISSTAKIIAEVCWDSHNSSQLSCSRPACLWWADLKMDLSNCWALWDFLWGAESRLPIF